VQHILPARHVGRCHGHIYKGQLLGLRPAGSSDQFGVLRRAVQGPIGRQLAETPCPAADEARARWQKARGMPAGRCQLGQDGADEDGSSLEQGPWVCTGFRNAD
jgi:hypothetical protein